MKCVGADTLKWNKTVDPKEVDDKHKVRELWKTVRFKSDDSDAENNNTYVKQTKLDQIDSVILKFIKPLHPRGRLKLLVRNEVKEENQNDKKWLLTTDPLQPRKCLKLLL